MVSLTNPLRPFKGTDQSMTVGRCISAWLVRIPREARGGGRRPGGPRAAAGAVRDAGGAAAATAAVRAAVAAAAVARRLGTASPRLATAAATHEHMMIEIEDETGK